MKKTLIALFLLMFSATLSVAQDRRAADALNLAMAAVNGGDWGRALQVIAPAGEVGRDIVDWHRLRAGEGSFSEYQDFLARNADWPGLPLMIEKGEGAIETDEKPQSVITYFKDHAPETGIGAMRLINAYKVTGQTELDDKLIVDSWISLSLTEDEEFQFLNKFADQLADHHVTRQDNLIWADRLTEAKRMNRIVSVDYQALTNARIALLQLNDGVDALVAAVPGKLTNHPGLAYARYFWRAKKGLTAGAIDMMLKASVSAEALGHPENWADSRENLARELMRDGKSKTAYRLASQHFLTSGDSFAELEWLAGFIALTDLKDADAALRHFQNFRVAVFTPISLGRAGYWEGRALEALGRTIDAQTAYAFGGEFQTSYYGQLAAEKAGLEMDAGMIGREHYADFRQSVHAQSSVFKAAMLFHDAGHPLLFTRFIRHLAESLNADERGSLAQLALNIDETFAAVYLAKYAADNGAVLMRPYFPVTEIAKRELPVEAALALSIARRESEFYAAARSPVGARGLMQLMPRTGEAMADKLGLPFSVDRLIDDPHYNTTLGSAYLARLIDEFGPAMPLVAAAYNAGPSRPKRWSELYGDPRANNVDAVDWVEHIPFRETRNYVMRIMESLPIYRARISGKTGPLRLSQELKGR